MPSDSLATAAPAGPAGTGAPSRLGAETTPAAVPAERESREPETSVATFADMRLKVGDYLPLEPRVAVSGGQATVQVLGWLEPASLIVTLPRNAAGRIPLREGETVTLRAFTGRSAFAFKSVVLRIAYNPFGYLHLRFPDKVDAVVVRRSFRHRLRMPATARVAGTDVPATIVNIGTTGALVETAAPFESSAEPMRLSASFQLHEVDVSLDVKAAIRSVRVQEAGPESAASYHYGVEFQELTPNDRLILGSLLWFEMHERPHESV